MSTSTEPGTARNVTRDAVTAAVEGFVPDQSRGERRASFDPNDYAPLTGREEDWRFTPLDRLRGLVTGADAAGRPPTVEVGTPAGSSIERVGRTDPRLGAAGTPEDKAAAQAWASFAQATVVTIAAEAAVAEPVRIAVTGQGGTSYEHLAVIAERHSSAIVVLAAAGALDADDSHEPGHRVAAHVMAPTAHLRP